MTAGFSLAALLSDDRDLSQVEAALEPQLLPGLHAELARALTESRELGLRGLLRVLRPELDPRAVFSLPVRMRGLLVRHVPARERQALRAGSLPSRADFDADEDLLQALVRIARSAARSEEP